MKNSINTGVHKRHRQFSYFAVLLFATGLTGIQAQDAIPAAGGDALANGHGSVSYSVGQVVYATCSGTNGSVIQGVQQPFEISVVSATGESGTIDLLASVYPNPATDHLILSVEIFEITNLSYQLFDMDGKLLKSEKLSGYETTIEMNHLVPSVYFIKVIGRDKEIKTFKIIKN